MNFDRTSQGRQVVAPLQQRDDPAAGVTLRRLDHELRHPAIAFLRDLHSGQQIVPVSKGPFIHLITGARGQRQIQDIPFPPLFPSAGTGVERPLMGASVENGRVLFKSQDSLQEDELLPYLGRREVVGDGGQALGRLRMAGTGLMIEVAGGMKQPDLRFHAAVRWPGPALPI